MNNKPTGNVTFLFTDIEGSTKLSQEFPDTLQTALERHHTIMHKVIESNNGFVFEIVGDAFCCAFEKAEDAVKSAVDAQINFLKEDWNDAVIKIRIGIHRGKAEWNGKGYMGYITLARTHRVMSAAHGGQILMSEDVYGSIKNDTGNDISYRDLGERRLKDLIQPVKIFQILSSAIGSDFPPLKTLDARPNNLPIQLTNFIGREKEISDVKNLLSKTKLLTLLGSGGTGKTRLSMQVAADMIDEFANGVWLVEFAPLTDPVLIPLTIARSLGVSEQTNQDTEITLFNYLKDKELLIILDNCEHLIDECAAITEKLLQNCSKLKIIATSRETLRCKGEITHKVLSLAHPEPKQINTPLELSQFEAVRLFIERALSVNSNFRVTNENAPALAQICFQLDGIPLAIELAAARIKVLTVEKICEKLDDRFRLLTGGRRTALPRQQTLKALIDWSYDLLPEKEKILFQQLSVFSGGWTLEAAEEICSDVIIESYETIDIMDTHTNLLDKSLINTTETSGSIRFNMLESIKQYAKEKFINNEEIKRKHFYFFRNLADFEKMISDGIEQKDWIKLNDAELDNMRSAIQWASENEQTEVCNLINDITEFWNIKGYFLEGLQICRNLLSADLKVDEFYNAIVIYNAALLSYNVGNLIESQKYISECISVFRKVNNKLFIAKCLNVQGVLLNLNMSEENEALKYYNEAISLFRECESKKDIAVTLYNMSFIFHKKGEFDKTLEYRTEALNIYKELNETHQISMILASLGIFEFRRNNFEQSRAYTEESLSISYQIGNKYLISINLFNLGCYYSEIKEYERALELLEESLEISRECGYKSNYLVILIYIGEIKSNLGEEDKAIKLYKESIQTGSDIGIDFFLGKNFYRLGISYFNLKDFERSVKYFSFLKNSSYNYGNSVNAKNMLIAEDYLVKLKEILGSEKYESCLNESSILSKEDAIGFALKSE